MNHVFDGTPVAATPQASPDVLDVDDRIVDDNAQRDCNTAESHRIDGPTHGVDHDHCRQQRQGNRRERDEHAAKVAQEQKQHERDQSDADQNVDSHPAECILDEIRGTMHPRIERNAFRIQPRLESGDSFLGSARDHERVGAVLARQGEQHAGFSLDDRITELRRRSVLHRSEVLQSERWPLLRRNDRLAKGCRRESLTATLDEHALVGRLDESATSNTGRFLHRRDDIREGKIARVQGARADFDLQLTLVTSIHGRPRDAGNREQSWANRPLHEVAKLHGREAIAHETELEQIHGGRHQWRQLRGLHSNGKSSSDLRNGFPDDLPSAIRVAVIREDHRDVGQARYRL